MNFPRRRSPEVNNLLDMPKSGLDSSDATHSRTEREPPLRSRGSNHVGMRQFNERVVLQAIRVNGCEI